MQLPIPDFGTRSMKYLPKIQTKWLYHRVIRPKEVDGMSNNVDPDQTAQEQSDLGLHCRP